MKSTAILLLSILIIACSSEGSKDEKITSKPVIKQFDTLASKKDLDQKTFQDKALKPQQRNLSDKIIPIQKDSVSVYVNIIDKFYSWEDLYISMFYRDNAEIPDYFDGEIIYQNQEEIRKKLDEQAAVKFLKTENLDSLLIFNKNQSLIDTVHRKNFEYYEDVIESEIIASYRPSEKMDTSSVSISYINGIEQFLKPGKSFQRNATLLKKLSARFLASTLQLTAFRFLKGWKTLRR